MNAKNLNNALEQCDDKESNIGNCRISPKVIEDGIRIKTEPLDEQIANLVQLLNQLINNNLAKTTPMAGHCAHLPHPKSSSNISRLLSKFWLEK